MPKPKKQLCLDNMEAMRSTPIPISRRITAICGFFESSLILPKFLGLTNSKLDLMGTAYASNGLWMAAIEASTN